MNIPTSLIALSALIIGMSALFTLLMRRTAIKYNIVDVPKPGRKIHKKAIPFLGGVAIFLTFFIVLFLFKEILVMGNLAYSHWLGFFIGACFIMLGGFLDDKYDLPAKYQIIFPLIASFCVVIGGVGIEKVTNPLGGFLFLDFLKLPILTIGGKVYYFVLFSDILIIIWLMMMSYTTKLLDGLDGLVTGIVAIGSFVVFLFTMTDKYYQPDVGFAALVLAASCLGFLIFNWNPASIFLGEGGSVFLGYALGVLAIISGGKIAIALLVMGLPVMDLAWTIIRRLIAGKNPFKSSDRLHLHHRLLDAGLSQRQVVLIFYLFSSVFGFSALYLQSFGKVLALGFMLVVMFFAVVALNFKGAVGK